jgi:fatty-acyl-CoA synthase
MSTPDIGLANWFLQRALRSPERAALDFEGQTWSYAQMQQRTEQLAGRLHGLGARRGDRVAFLGLNQPMFLFALFASARLGAIFGPLTFRLTEPEVVANIGDADVGVLITNAQHRSPAGRIPGAQQKSPTPLKRPSRYHHLEESRLAEALLDDEP